MDWKRILWSAVSAAAVGAATAFNEEQKKGARTPMSGLPKRQPASISRRGFYEKTK